MFGVFQEKKHLKKIAKSVTHKVEKVGEKAKSKLPTTGGRDSKDSPEKLDNSLNRFSDPFAKIKGAPARGSPRQGSTRSGGGGGRLGGRNLDPGVNSDDEDDDDMFKLDALSHGGR